MRVMFMLAALAASTHDEASVRALLVCLLIVALVAGFVYLVGYLTGHRREGGLAALIVAFVGAILCLL